MAPLHCPDVITREHPILVKTLLVLVLFAFVAHAQNETDKTNIITRPIPKPSWWGSGFTLKPEDMTLAMNGMIRREGRRGVRGYTIDVSPLIRWFWIRMKVNYTDSRQPLPPRPLKAWEIADMRPLHVTNGMWVAELKIQDTKTVRIKEEKADSIYAVIRDMPQSKLEAYRHTSENKKKIREHTGGEMIGVWAFLLKTDEKWSGLPIYDHGQILQWVSPLNDTEP